MKALAALAILMLLWPLNLGAASDKAAGSGPLYILPVRQDIMPPLVYLVRRGVKEAMEAKADVMILDIHTDGGRVDVTEEIIEILERFDGKLVAYVNTRAFSAGAFISVAAEDIFMAPTGVIGAAAPIMMVPGGGVQEMPETAEAKMTSAVRALVRRTAERNGHNPEVLEAMIDKNKKLVMDGEVLSPEGDILTLTAQEAAKEYGEPPEPLLSSGTVETLEDLIERLGVAEAERVYIKPTGAETLGLWLNRISPILLLVGIIGIYLEMKMPGFGLPGLVGLSAFALYFIGGYVAGFSGLAWLVVFILGLTLVLLEVFLFAGTIFLGLIGALMILVSLVMAMVDIYPGGPVLPTLPQLSVPLREILLAFVGAALVAWALTWTLPKTRMHHRLVSQSASGERSVDQFARERLAYVGQRGVAISDLRPGGKAQFGEQVVDVATQGELIRAGTAVRVVGESSSAQLLVEADGTVDGGH